MRVVIMNSLYSPDIIGGAEISTQILAETLSKRGMEVSVVTVGAQSRSAGVIQDTVNGVDVIRLPHNNLYWLGDSKNKGSLSKVARRLIDIYNPLQIEEVRRVLRTIKPDLIHTQNLSGLGTGVWKVASELNIPVVHTLRDYSLLSPMSTTNIHPMIKGLYKQLPMKFSRGVSAVIGISSHILNKHVQSGLFAPSNKYVIPNAVDGDIRVTPKEVNTGSLVIGCFGRLESEKGVQYLVEAVKKLPRDMVQKVYICGEGGMKEQLVKDCGSDDRFVFTGKVPPAEARRLMGEVDISIVPSTWDEPFGRVIIESYQVGTPVFASTVGGIPDVVTKPEDCLFKPGDADAIAHSIRSYFGKTKEQKEELHALCLQHCQLFTTSALAARHMEVYSLILGTVLESPRTEAAQTMDAINA
ncbi:glycosyl transferase family 1 [Paenibacillus mucilaginosus K02]|uniref:Glycosyl transferase family 1 n=2 Tax=Paenibacillus mucilaginosus K02 TaxID=997761 RepID=I0BSE8_9BACL|nr:glycosyl transferase family 1 [Paenibacillus mucilaginosus K02]